MAVLRPAAWLCGISPTLAKPNPAACCSGVLCVVPGSVQRVLPAYALHGVTAIQAGGGRLLSAAYWPHLGGGGSYRPTGRPVWAAHTVTLPRCVRDSCSTAVASRYQRPGKNYARVAREKVKKS